MDANHTYTNGSNLFQVGFAKSTTKTNSTVKFQMVTNTVEFLPVDALATTAVVKGDTITYPNVYAGINFHEIRCSRVVFHLILVN